MTEQPTGGDEMSAQSSDESAPTGAAEAGLPKEEEPTTTGTMFVMLLFLMALAGMWGLMYMVLLER
jgi:hypothetical protein